MIDDVVAAARQMVDGLAPDVAARVPRAAGAAASTVSLVLRGDRDGALALAVGAAAEGLIADYLVALMVTIQVTVGSVVDNPADLAPRVEQLAAAWAVLDAERAT